MDQTGSQQSLVRFRNSLLKAALLRIIKKIIIKKTENISFNKLIKDPARTFQATFHLQEQKRCYVSFLLLVADLARANKRRQSKENLVSGVKRLVIVLEV